MRNFKLIKKGFLLSALTIFIFTFSIFIKPQYVKADESFPKPTEFKYVNDYADMIDKGSKEDIISIGKELEDKTGAQLVVVTINSLDNMDIDYYANKLFRTWGIGEKGKNNGLLILISKEDRKWKVEVGTGLEGVITDIHSSRIMEKNYVTNARKENYGEGIKYCYSIFVNDVAKEYGTTIENNNKIKIPNNSPKSKESNGLGIIGLIVLFILLDSFLNKGRIMNFLFWNSQLNKRRGPFDDDDNHFGGFGGFGGGSGGDSGGFGGFGGGSSSGGGSSGSW